MQHSLIKKRGGGQNKHQEGSIMLNHKTKVRRLAKYLAKFVAKQAKFCKTIYLLCPQYTLATFLFTEVEL